MARKGIAMLLGATMVVGGWVVRTQVDRPDDLGDAELEDVYGLRFDDEDEQPAVCAVDVMPLCTGVSYLGFEVAGEPAWATRDALVAGSTPTGAYVLPAPLLAALPEEGGPALEVSEPVVETQVVATTADGSPELIACARDATPMTCLVREATVVTMPDPGTDVVGTAVVVALAREASPDGTVDEAALSAAVDLLADARTAPEPVRALLSLGAPDGEVALDADRHLFDPDLEERAAILGARWPRTPTSIEVAVGVAPDEAEADRIEVLLTSDVAAYDLTQGGLHEIGEELYLDTRPAPGSGRPTAAEPVTAEELLAARAAWAEARG